MIEMLGVLAIIGVLSAGGIWGYSKAMEIHNLNSIIAEIETVKVNLAAYFKHTPTKNTIITAEQLQALGFLSKDFVIYSDPYYYYKKKYNGNMAANTYVSTPLWTYSCKDFLIPPISYMAVVFYNPPLDWCIKLATREWNKGGSTGIFIEINQSHCKDKPFTMQEATAYCSTLNAYGRLDVTLNFVY